MKAIIYSKAGVFLSILLFRLLLDLTYVQIVNPLYEYYGFSITYGSHTFFSWLILAGFSLLAVKFIDIKDWFISNVILLFFLLRFVPMTSIMGFIPMNDGLLMLECLYWFCLLLFAYFMPSFRIEKPKIRSNVFIYICFFLFSLVILFISGYYTGFRLNFSLFNVYDLRLEAREFDIPTLLQYLWAASRNILPLVFIYFVSRKNKKMAIITAVLIFLNFSINGLKSTLFKLLVAIIAYYIYKRRISYSYSWYFVLLCFFALMEQYILGSAFLGVLFVRRVLFLPSLLDYYYYDYISETGPTYFSLPNGTPVSYSIGQNYFFKEEANANNGLFSDAYTNLGAIGCIVFPLALVVLWKMLSSVSKDIAPKMLILPVILVVLTFNSGFFTVSLLTNGILLLLLYLYFLKLPDPCKI